MCVFGRNAGFVCRFIIQIERLRKKKKKKKKTNRGVICCLSENLPITNSKYDSPSGSALSSMTKGRESGRRRGSGRQKAESGSEIEMEMERNWRSRDFGLGERSFLI